MADTSEICLESNEKETRLFLRHNLSRTPLFSNEDGFIHIPGQETIRRRLYTQTIVTANNQASTSSASSNVDEDVKEHIQTILSPIQLMDTEMAKGVIRDCTLSYRFFIKGYQWMQCLEAVFPVKENMPYIHRYAWVYWIQNYYWLDIVDDRSLVQRMNPIVERLLKLPLPIPDEEELYHSPRSLHPKDVVSFL